jgi:periplasmic divalent cation tolerance protein
METVSLYSTWPNAESAAAAARSLIEDGLIACANILPGAQSVFRWEGAVQAESEAVMFAKTTTASAAGARDALLRLHPYTCPCVIALPALAEGSNPAFLDWVAAETTA